MPIGPVASVVVPAAISAIGSIWGSKNQKSASRDASRQEARFTSEALKDAREERDYSRRRDDEQMTYDRGQRASYLERLKPFTTAGQQAITNIAASTQSQLPGSVPTMGSGQMIQMRAPNGQVREVPASQAEWYLSRGATRV